MDTGSGRVASGTDRISGLPDDLLHNILLRLQSTNAAARTCVLSRRWRGVWARLPDLHLWNLRPVLPASCVTIVDGATAACSAPTLRRLVIRVDDVNMPWEGVTAAHVAPWLRFASDRVAGELFLWLPVEVAVPWIPEQDLDLPVFAATSSIQVRLRTNFRLRPPVAAAGPFAALRCLGIYNGTMDGRELGALVSSSQCPCLEDLSLEVRLATESDVSICSGSLKRLRFHVENSRKLVVDTPELLEICVSDTVAAHIAAPKLADVELRDDMDRYELAEVGSHIQRLVVYLRVPVPAILRRFDTIGELIVNRLLIQPGSEGYVAFTKELRKLDCESLVLQSTWNCHNSVSSMLHLLRICNGLKKLVVNLRCFEGSCNFPGEDCPCTWRESYTNDNVALDSLEEVEINGFTGKDRQLEYVNLLLRCNTPLLKGVVFRLSPNDLCKCMSIIQNKIHDMLPPDIELRVCLVDQKSIGILEKLNPYA